MLCTLTTRAAAGAAESAPAAAESVMLANGNVDKQKAMGEEYKQTKYWRRHRRYKTAAYCVLGVGACATLMGIAVICSDWKGEWEEAQAVYGAAFTGGGVVIAAASIPLFVAAHRNKKKAKNAVALSFNCSSTTAPVADGARRRNPMLGVCLNF